MYRIATEGRVVNGNAKGAVVVYAAGNYDADVSVNNGFADDENTVAVANCAVNPYVDPSDPKRFERVSISNFGSAIDLCALGDQSYTLVPGGDGQWAGGGTSAACAAVAGAIGLLLTAFPEETHAQILDRLRTGAERVDPNQTDPEGIWVGDHSGYYGHGLLNLLRSMQ
jgi:subtilisin family serine protease